MHKFLLAAFLLLAAAPLYASEEELVPTTSMSITADAPKPWGALTATIATEAKDAKRPIKSIILTLSTGEKIEVPAKDFANLDTLPNSLALTTSGSRGNGDPFLTLRLQFDLPGPADINGHTITWHLKHKVVTFTFHGKQYVGHTENEYNGGTLTTTSTLTTVTPAATQSK